MTVTCKRSVPTFQAAIPVHVETASMVLGESVKVTYLEAILQCQLISIITVSK